MADELSNISDISDWPFDAIDKTVSNFDSDEDELEVAVKNIPAETDVDNISVDGSFTTYYNTHDLEKNRFNLSSDCYKDGTPNPSFLSPGTPTNLSDRGKTVSSPRKKC